MTSPAVDALVRIGMAARTPPPPPLVLVEGVITALELGSDYRPQTLTVALDNIDGRFNCRVSGAFQLELDALGAALDGARVLVAATVSPPVVIASISEDR